LSERKRKQLTALMEELEEAEQRDNEKPNPEVS